MPFFQTVPLGCDDGTIRLHFNEHDDLQRAGYFSTTLYYRSDKPFNETDYYFGIKIYTKIINEHYFFEDVGFIIYTDHASYRVLAENFGALPKVIIAVLSWPRFQIRKNVIEGTVLRCLRFQAKVLFPHAWVAVRDADTIFAYEINNALIKKELKFVSAIDRIITDITYRSNKDEIFDMLAGLIGNWEKTFINKWLLAGDKIVLSTSDKYLASWHKELPFTYTPKPLTVDPTINDKDYKYVAERNHIKRLLMEDRSTFGVLFDAPLGVFAGFAHLGIDAPKSFWSACCNYLVSHYKVVKDTLRNRMIISNTYSSVGAIGKDERMLIFGAMPAYFDDIYFVHLDYYGGLGFKEPIINPSSPRMPVLEHLGIHTSYISIPNPDIDPVSEEDRRDKEIKIGGKTFQSLLLSPIYALMMYEFPYVEKYEHANRFELYESGTMNEHFKELFAHMLRNYMQFKQNVDKIGLSQLEKFGAPIERAGRTVVPSLRETVYEPIEKIRPKVFVRTRKGKEWFNNRAETRRYAKGWSAAKKTRRSRPNLRANNENENN